MMLPYQTNIQLMTIALLFVGLRIAIGLWD